MVTAADRAAATYAAWGTNPSARFAGTSPFRGGFVGSAAKGLPPQRELSAVRLTEDKPLLWGSALSRREGISSTIRSANGPPPSAEGGEGVCACVFLKKQKI